MPRRALVQMELPMPGESSVTLADAVQAVPRLPMLTAGEVRALYVLIRDLSPDYALVYGRFRLEYVQPDFGWPAYIFRRGEQAIGQARIYDTVDLPALQKLLAGTLARYRIRAAGCTVQPMPYLKCPARRVTISANIKALYPRNKIPKKDT